MKVRGKSGTRRTSRRIPITGTGKPKGAKPSTSRPLYTSRTYKGPFLPPSEKSGGLAPCESSLESLLVAAANLDTRVKHIRTQPFVMDVGTGLCAPTRADLADKLKQHGFDPAGAVHWFVDALVERFDRIERTLIEAKPGHKARQAKTAEKLQNRSAACRRAGYGYATVTDEFFEVAFKSNVRILRRYQDHIVNDTTKAALVQVAREAGERGLTIGQLATKVLTSVADVYSLIADGTLRAFLRQEVLDTQARVTTAEGAPLHFLPLDE